MMMNDQEALCAYMSQATGGLMALFGHSLKAIGKEAGMALVDELEAGRVDLHFKAKVDSLNVVISATLIYPDGREVPIFEDTAAHFPMGYQQNAH
jgi:hypothetical protein